MAIWVWIKSRIESDEAYKSYHNNKTKIKQNRYCPRSHTTMKKGKVARVKDEK